MSEPFLSCVHCLAPLKKEEVLWYEIGGKLEPFCCAGCYAIRLAIREADLEAFYERRKGWIPGQPEFKEVEETLFEDSVKRLSEEEAELKLGISGLRCAACVWLIEKFLRKKKGIKRVNINFATHRATISFNPQEISLKEILSAITSLGYLPLPGLTSDPEKVLEAEAKDLLIRFGTAGFFSMQLMLYTVSLYAGYFQGIDPELRRFFEFLAWGLSTPVMFYSAQPFWKNFFMSLRLRELSMDVLIILGSFSAYLYSVGAIFLEKEVYFDTSAMIITFILLGRYLEKKMRFKASSLLRLLLSYQPRYATKVSETGEVLVLLETLKEGDLVVVRPGEKIPVDGVVVEGCSEVQESLFTGEPMPVYKDREDYVYAGSLNINGRLIIKVKAVKETLLSKILHAVTTALEEKPRLQTLADRVIKVFVPGILIIALVTFLYWNFHVETKVALLRAVSVLVIACPCALGLALPLVYLIATQRSYELGILIKDSTLFERVPYLNKIAFDKTGTLTKGEPRIVEVKTYSVEEDSALKVACGLESGSSHPIAKAFLKAVKGPSVPKLTQFRNYPGRGIEGYVEGKIYYLGNQKFMDEKNLEMPDQALKDLQEATEKGFTPVFLGDEKKVLALFIVDDTIREEAREVVRSLKDFDMEIWLLSGDEERSVKRVANFLHIDYFISKATPMEKAELIKKWQEKEEKVLMIGDGINDAPALAVSYASLALSSGVELAMESAQGVFIKKDLRSLPRFLMLSRKALKIAKENLFWAFSYNSIAIPLAVMGKIHPVISAILMALSSLFVVANSLRLTK
ncbi:MAG: heavy metal translocating P-type ATPase [Caldimicrobium sp.]|nr:heavy metal translocating P-type ATPase [Caldimicrobium sp.]MCX7613222.1 heavy metal translocating P-type ATPase [Caldimicrobium sp.]MDW8182476.1 heavy metal translocating P-type ATPase metal-binding domain-containing protein [Caldimicrobium sp.]